MPTGYTYPVCKGEVTDFAEFAMQCARAFGALIMMRDDPPNAPIPAEFSPSDWNKQGLDEARTRLAEIEKMSAEQIEAAALADYESAKVRYDEYEAEETLADQRLDQMLSKVRAWSPPTAEHQGLKDFMIEQITMSKRGSYRSPEPKLLTPADWQTAQIEKLHYDIGYHAGEYAKEVERARGRTAWVKALRASLATTPDNEAA